MCIPQTGSLTKRRLPATGTSAEGCCAGLRELAPRSTLPKSLTAEETTRTQKRNLMIRPRKPMTLETPEGASPLTETWKTEMKPTVMIRLGEANICKQKRGRQTKFCH